MKSLYLIFFTIVLSACSSIELHSDSSYFISSIGIKTLNTDILLCQNEEVRSEHYGLVKFRIWEALERDECLEPFGKTITKLTKGTNIKILDLEEHKHLNLFQYQHWYFIGEVVINNENQKVYYYYSLTTDSPEVPELPEKLLWD